MWESWVRESRITWLPLSSLWLRRQNTARLCVFSGNVSLALKSLLVKILTNKSQLCFVFFTLKAQNQPDKAILETPSAPSPGNGEEAAAQQLLSECGLIQRGGAGASPHGPLQGHWAQSMENSRCDWVIEMAKPNLFLCVLSVWDGEY